MKKTNEDSYITSWGLQQSITNKIPTTERLRLYKHWKLWTLTRAVYTIDLIIGTNNPLQEFHPEEVQNEIGRIADEIKKNK